MDEGVRNVKAVDTTAHISPVQVHTHSQLMHREVLDDTVAEANDGLELFVN